MPETLSINLVPGYLPGDDELITPAILRLLARPTVTLEGSLGAASIADGAVTTAKLADGVLSADTTGRNKMADGYLTAAKLNATQDWTGKTLEGSPTVNWSTATLVLPAGHQYQEETASDGTAVTVVTNIPYDDTIPQNGEGGEILTVTITPRFATSLLVIHAVAFAALDTNGNATLALFQDSAADALAATGNTDTTASGLHPFVLDHVMTAGTAVATTFKLRIGAAASNVFVNGGTANRKYGGVLKTFISVREIAT